MCELSSKRLTDALLRTATDVNASLLHFQGKLQDFGSHVFGQHTACTASEELQFLVVTNMTVPVEEISRFTIKTWQAPNALGAQIQNLTYFDLETGRVVTADTVYDWDRALTYFNYSILLPNIVDMPAYQEAVLRLNYTVSNLTTGQTTASRSCQSPIPQLQSVSDYINTVLTQNLSDVSNLNGGLRPTELKLPGGCISESSVNYEGDVLQSIRTGRTSQVWAQSIQSHCHETVNSCMFAVYMALACLISNASYLMLLHLSHWLLCGAPIKFVLDHFSQYW